MPLPRFVRTTLLLGIAALCANLSADTRERAVFDFEDGLPGGLRLDNAKLVRNPGDGLISGTGSLACDSRASGKEWNEFLQTDPEQLRLLPYHRYRIAFEYRVPDRGSNSFYYLLRSESQREHGGNFDQMFWFHDDGTGHGRIEREFELAGIDDMYLIVGIRGGAVLSIDDLSIEDLGAAGSIEATPIDPGGPAPYADELAWIERRREIHGTVERMRRMIVVLCNEGAGAKAEPERMVRDLEPDYIDWNPIGPLGARYGIRTSASRMEYQGYYRRENEEYWDRRFELFTGHGFLVTLYEDIHQSETWGEGGYAMCQNGRNWNRCFREKLLPVLDTYEDVCQDNLTWSNFNMHGGFCKDCEEGFRRYLRSKYPAERLAAWGIGDLDVFSVRAYLRAHPRERGLQALSNPFLREFIKYQNQSQLGAWCGHVVACKRRGIELGRDVAVYGNQTGIDVFPYAVALSVFGDAVEVEGYENAYYYLLGRGSGNERKAVFTRGGLTAGDLPNLSVPFWKARFGLGLAFGGQRVISLGWNDPRTGDPKIPDYIDDPDLYSFFRRYAAFLRRNRAIYGPQRCYTKLGVLWSYPTQMWRAFPPLELYPHAQRSEFQRVGNWLMDEHLPFDVLVLGHPDLWDDRSTLGRLSEYEDLIAPGIDCLDAAQRKALRQWAQVPGHRLWTTGDFGTRDQDFNNLSAGDPGDPIPRRRAVLDDALAETLRARAPIRTDAPPSLIVNPFRDPDNRWVTIHLFNRKRDTWNGEGPKAPRCRITVEIPEGANFDSARAISYEHDPIPIEADASDPGSYRFQAPPVDHYAVIVLADRKALEEAQRDAEEWILRDRERVKKLMSRNRTDDEAR